MKRNYWSIASSIFAILNGVICILFTEDVLNFLPTICAIAMMSIGVTRFISGLKNKDYLSLEQVDMEKSIVIFIVGIGVMIRQENALFIVGVFWGLHGLLKASNYLNEALYYMSIKEKFLVSLFKAVIELILSIILIFDPFSSIEHHIVILGVEIIMDTILEWISPKIEKRRSS
ncbi:MAG: hypothetical protein Q4F66_01325 [Clostridium sp.]|nr:hypothetical protein [Clostridium sp.]